MSEETNNIDVNIEQILAAILKSNGKQIVEINDLVADYSEYSIAVNQEDDGKLSFEIVSVKNVE